MAQFSANSCHPYEKTGFTVEIKMPSEEIGNVRQLEREISDENDFGVK